MKITNSYPVDWIDLQNKVCKLLNEAGYHAESPKEIDTVRGTVEVDVLATSKMELVKQFICECKFWNTSIPKKEIHAFRTVVNDSGSMLGIFISKAGYQSGAYEAAYCSNVLLKDWEGFINLIEKQWILTQTVRIKKIAQPLSVYTDPCDVPFEKLSNEEREKYTEITNKCIEAYIICRDVFETLKEKESIVVNKQVFTAYDELYSYFEELFLDTIKDYESLFANNPVEVWKLKDCKHLMIQL